MLALIADLVERRLAFEVDGDVVFPLDGNAHLPHGVLLVGASDPPELTALGRALDVALQAGLLPDQDAVPADQRAAVSVRRRQVLAIVRRMRFEGVVGELPDPPPGSSGGAAIPWTDRSLDRDRT